ncbi:DUF2017 family protein [uncultured Varibaculum sp.]|uniref:DUF2017 family protein n=1 Tax=uncultured Varibaculum sp. TaxID=413896 RepID=UPI002599D95F|nr:DUF2017 family protein [uncultured Varibaculum sp.]
MNIFRPVPGGWVCQIGEVERGLFLKAISEVRTLLDPPVLPFEITTMLGEDDSEGAAKDIHLSNASLDRLLPPGAADERTAQTMRDLTDSQLRTQKAERLDRLYQILSEQTGSALVIKSGQEWDWLGGINDVRLAISGKLSPEDLNADSQPDKQMSSQVNPKTGNEKFEEALVSSFYEWLSGWQDSLLQAIDSWPQPS